MAYSKLSQIKNKKAAIELSISTVVIIVIAMTMLIMGVVLVKNIFSGATDSVDALNDKVKGELTNLFAEEGSKVAVRLGSTKLAKIKQGSEDFGVAIGAKPESGGGSAESLRYDLIIRDDPNDCIDANSEAEVKDLIRFHNFGAGGGLESHANEFEDFEGSEAYTRIRFNVPEDFVPCTQRITVKVFDSTGGASAARYAQQTFSIQIVEKGIFGN
ncbi:MAG: hypothetical protein ABH864_04520 [archaeon]